MKINVSNGIRIVARLILSPIVFIAGGIEGIVCWLNIDKQNP